MKHSASTIRLKLGAAAAAFLSLLSATPALAGAPVLDSGEQINNNDVYSKTQQVGDVYQNHAIYGKLEGDTPVDIYHFKPSKDGQQTFSLLSPKLGQPAAAQPVLIFVDPTDATEAQQIAVPLPTTSDKYHAAVVTQSTTASTVTERLMLQSYNLQAKENIKLKKDTDYYLLVFDPYRVATRYVIQLGDGTSWTAKDFFSNFGSWIRLQTDTYAQTSPFKSAGAATWGFVILLLGMAALIGVYLIQQVLGLLANRRKTAAYLLIKLQQMARIIIWIALWFILMGGVIFLQKIGLTGIPFVLTLLYIPLLIVFLYQTLGIYPKLNKVEITKQEAAIPLGLRKLWFAIGFVEFIIILPMVILMGMFFATLAVK